MPYLRLFYRLILRPLLRERNRTALTVFAVALGVAVVLAIDLAGNAAAGSFHSSLEALAGDNNLEVSAAGGIPEGLAGTLASLPYAIRISPRIEDYAVLQETKQTVPLIGLDLVAEAGQFTRGAGSSRGAAMFDCAAAAAAQNQTAEEPRGPSDDPLSCLTDPASIWIPASLHHRAGDQLQLLLNDQLQTFTVRGVYADSAASGSAIVMDIAAAQRALARRGRIDRILIKTPSDANAGSAMQSQDEWQRRLQAALPPGVSVRPEGSGTAENRRMLSAFRWNLRLLSYIALIVGAFLIYNTISVSVVRRRSEIGIVRALGGGRGAVVCAFLSEAATLGLAGALLGLPLGRFMAAGAVDLMSATVRSLYTSSRPGEIGLTWSSVIVALLAGAGVALVSAYWPAREAAYVAPVQAMARARREYEVSVRRSRDLLFVAAFALAAAAASRMPPVAGKPFFGYMAAILLITGASLAIPAFVATTMRGASRRLGRWLGAEVLLASRSLAASLRRTSVLVAALATAVAMMVSVGIMVGSFRETVITWMEQTLPADLYIRPAGETAADRHPTLSAGLADSIAQLPGVAAMDRLRAYEITYENAPVFLGGADFSAYRAHRASDFFSGRPAPQVYAELRGANAVLVSEPFTYKHHAKIGDIITLPLGAARAEFRIADVYSDYSNERGEIIMDWATLLRYLPDPAPSNLAVYVAPGARIETVRAEISQVAAGHRILVFSDREIRAEAIRIFDRTFAITYALEAVAVLVAVMGVAGAFVALVIDRRRELGLLRFLGAASGQIRKLILAEAALLGLLASAAGAALGYLLSLVLIFVINKQSFGWTIRFHWPVAILAAALSFVWASTVLASLYPAKIALRLNPLEVLHED